MWKCTKCQALVFRTRYCNLRGESVAESVFPADAEGTLQEQVTNFIRKARASDCAED